MGLHKKQKQNNTNRSSFHFFLPKQQGMRNKQQNLGLLKIGLGTKYPQQGTIRGRKQHGISSTRSMSDINMNANKNAKNTFFALNITFKCHLNFHYSSKQILLISFKTLIISE